MTNDLKELAVTEAQAYYALRAEELLQDEFCEDQDFADLANEIVEMSKVDLKWEWAYSLEVIFKAI